MVQDCVARGRTVGLRHHSSAATEQKLSSRRGTAPAVQTPAPLIAWCSLSTPGEASNSWNRQGATSGGQHWLWGSFSSSPAAAPCHTMPCHAEPHHTASDCIMPWWALPHHAVLLCVMPYCILPHHKMLHGVPPHCPVSQHATWCHSSPSLASTGLL